MQKYNLLEKDRVTAENKFTRNECLKVNGIKATHVH